MLHIIIYFAKSLKVIQDHWKWRHSIDRIRVPIVSMVLSRISSEIKRDIRRNMATFPYHPCILRRRKESPSRNIAITFGTERN